MATGVVGGTVKTVESKTSKAQKNYQVVTIVEELGNDKTQQVRWINFAKNDGTFYLNPKVGDILLVEGANVKADAFLPEGETRPVGTLSFTRGEAKVLYRPAPVAAAAAPAAVVDEEVDPMDEIAGDE